MLAIVGVLLARCASSGFGHSGGGAARWLSLGPVHVQPAEMAKLALVIWLAYSLAKKAERVKTFTVGLPPAPHRGRRLHAPLPEAARLRQRGRPAPPDLWLLPSGALDADSPSLLTPDSLKSRFTQLRDSFEFVIVHGAPLAGYAETLILGRVTDGLALVLEAGSTRREAAATAMENLRSSNIPIVAAVLNKSAAPTSKKFFR